MSGPCQTTWLTILELDVATSDLWVHRPALNPLNHTQQPGQQLSCFCSTGVFILGGGQAATGRYRPWKTDFITVPTRRGHARPHRATERPVPVERQEWGKAQASAVPGSPSGRAGEPFGTSWLDTAGCGTWPWEFKAGTISRASEPWVTGEL